MKLILISTFAVAVLLLGSGGVTQTVADPLTYKLEGKTVAVIGCDNALGELVIPSSYGGKQVTRIGTQAFQNCSSLMSVTIPNLSLIHI